MQAPVLLAVSGHSGYGMTWGGETCGHREGPARTDAGAVGREQQPECILITAGSSTRVRRAGRDTFADTSSRRSRGERGEAVGAKPEPQPVGHHAVRDLPLLPPWAKPCHDPVTDATPRVLMAYGPPRQHLLSGLAGDLGVGGPGSCGPQQCISAGICGWPGRRGSSAFSFASFRSMTYATGG